jgi:hypothetical protein
VEPVYAHLWREQACLFLRSGDEAGYREVCRRLLARFGGADSNEPAEVARACALAPGAVADPERVLRVAQWAVTEQPKSGPCQHALALACLRTGRADLAVVYARRTLEVDPSWRPNDPLSWLVLALALPRTGQAEEARAWRKKAEEAIAARASAAEGDPCGKVPARVEWSDWASMQTCSTRSGKRTPAATACEAPGGKDA